MIIIALFPANPLFSFTSGRWLCNNDAQVRSRYAPFNVDGLHRVASKAMGSQVQSMEKIAESLNRVFLVTSQNGQQVIARTPTPISGPPHFSTASEVATMDFLRRIGIPVPKVLAWSSRAQSTEVESEFIIMEKAEGLPLTKLWDNVDRADLVNKLAQLHRPLLDLRFTRYGSLYYKTDIDGSYSSTADFLESVPAGLDISPFCIGPLARRDFWEDERTTMDANRGPWASALEYMIDVATREQTWIDRYAKPHIHDDFLCGLPLQGKRDDHIELLEYYKYMLPYLVPEDSRYLHGHLWHPDLHAANLFVTPSGPTTEDEKVQANITSCIDWQGAWVGPAFLQLTVPVMFRALGAGPEALSLPPHFETLDAATRKEAERFHNEAVLQNLFETLALRDIAQLPALAERRELEELAQGTWRTGLLPFRETLIKVVKRWNDIAPGQKCPVDFTLSECEDHAGAYAYWAKHRVRADALEEEFSLGEFGYVAGDLAHLVSVQTQLEKRRKEWVASGSTDEERMVKEILWPYRDTLCDNPRSHLMLDTKTLHQ
ncbi:hypothetical protein GALMADRAFT_256362 [Galerina marginata CBS 339.88]|uniref:Uncharacterized protein n=1 Tax=Galerina marginata (strain CBS 339.88) TaxID=685588 RepID=A0A067SGK7_GALM3|nr:hypothetical protein GALMADRAFT_256362 [Galerina marginata CBS 339.88]